MKFICRVYALHVLTVVSIRYKENFCYRIRRSARGATLDLEEIIIGTVSSIN